MKTIWCNGEFLTAETLPVAPLDRGLILGLGLFETMLAVDGRVVFCNRHLARLAAGCEVMGWRSPQEEFPGLVEAMERLLVDEGLAVGRARLRMAISAGSGRLDDLVDGEDRLVWVAALPLTPSPEELAVTVAPWTRNERGALCGLKCASYAENLAALNQARRAGYQETLFFNTVDELCEAATANVFLVKEGVLRTPPLDSGCLAGITRRVVLELARREGIPCEEVALKMADLDAADEVILTSSTRGPVAATRLRATTLRPPELADRIRALWEAEIHLPAGKRDQVNK